SRRLERLAPELEAAREELSDLATQGDLFSDRAQLLSARVESARSGAQEAMGGLARLRAELESARAAELEAGERASSLAARRAALETMERDQEGLEPVLRAALQQGLGGVHG